MTIKRRKSLPDAGTQPVVQKLEIVAKPKKPIPERGVMRSLFLGKPPSPAQVRHVAQVAASCGLLPDDEFSIEDTLVSLRSSYDVNNAQELRYRNRVRNRGTAITAMCIVCQGGRKAVTECIATQCALWAFRFGSDPFYGKKNK